MISLEVLSLLTEDEVCMLLFIVNCVFPSLPEVDIATIKKKKKDHLEAKLKGAKQAVKPEYLPIYESLLNKLSVT